MASIRPSASILRCVRPTAGTAPLRSVQLRCYGNNQLDGKDTEGHMGGPGGQQPPPQNPGGPEAVARNWYVFRSPLSSCECAAR